MMAVSSIEGAKMECWPTEGPGGRPVLLESSAPKSKCFVMQKKQVEYNYIIATQFTMP